MSIGSPRVSRVRSRSSPPRRSRRSCAPPSQSRTRRSFLTAAFTGLRQGELLALRWRDIDFPGAIVRVAGSYGLGTVTTPKPGKVRSALLAPDVAEALARLGQRQHFTGDDDRSSPA
jgi:integrase